MKTFEDYINTIEVPENFELLRAFINYNIEDKKDCQTFWRK